MIGLWLGWVTVVGQFIRFSGELQPLGTICQSYATPGDGMPELCNPRGRSARAMQPLGTVCQGYATPGDGLPELCIVRPNLVTVCQSYATPGDGMPELCNPWGLSARAMHS